MVAALADTGEPIGSPASINADQYEAGLKKVLDLTNERILRNPYRHWARRDLFDQYEYWKTYQRAVQCRLAVNPDSDMTYEAYSAETNIAAIERELKMRQNVYTDSGGHPDLKMGERRSVDYDAVKALLRLEDVVEHFSPFHLEKHGRVLQCQCFLPGHDDSTPSFTVWPHNQSWHCFGCGRNGDVIELARHHFGQDNAAIACELVCKSLGREVPRTKDYRPPVQSEGVRGLRPDGTVVEFDPSLFKGRTRRRW